MCSRARTLRLCCCRRQLTLAGRSSTRTRSVQGVRRLSPATPTAWAAPSVAHPPARPRTASPPPNPPWQKALDAALEGDAELGHATPHVALFVELHQERRRRNTWQYAPVRKDTYVAARPAVRGARDKWIKGNASWDRLNGLPLSGKQAALMAELLSAYSQSRQGDYYYVPRSGCRSTGPHRAHFGVCSTS